MSGRRRGGVDAGMLLGTAAYMAPEQAKGHEADRRADASAFGCVLFEMLTGTRAFEGDTTNEVLANVLRIEPAWSRVPADIPAAVSRLLRRCLQKDPKLRLRDIGDARLEIDDARSEPFSLLQTAETSVRLKERLVWAGGVAVMTLVAITIGRSTIRPTPPEPVEFEIDTLKPPWISGRFR